MNMLRIFSKCFVACDNIHDMLYNGVSPTGELLSRTLHLQEASYHLALGPPISEKHPS